MTDVDKLANGNVVSVGKDRKIYIWNAGTGAQVRARTTAHSAGITSVRVLSDGTIATAAETGDNSIKIWDNTLTLQRTLSDHTNTINTLEILSNGYFVSGSVDKYAIVWDPTTGSKINKFYAIGASGLEITCIKQLSDGTIVFGGPTTSLYTYRLTGTNTQTLVSASASLLTTSACQAMMLYNSSLLAVASSGIKTDLINVGTPTSLFKIKSMSLGQSFTSCLDNKSNINS